MQNSQGFSQGVFLSQGISHIFHSIFTGFHPIVCVSETWRKDREEFFKDQQSNGEISLNYILMLNFLGQHTEKTMKIFFPSNIFMPGNNFLTLSAKIH